MRTVWWIMLCLVVAASAAAETPSLVSNDEYGYSVVFPAGAKPCPAMSGTHVHGDYANYDVKAVPCGEDPGPRGMALSIWADYNVMFYATPREASGKDCRKTTAAAVGLTASDTLIDGRPGIVCVRRDRGRTSVVVTVMAGRTDGAFGVDPDTPWIIYDVSLTTTPDRLRRDMPMFATFLRSVRLAGW